MSVKGEGDEVQNRNGKATENPKPGGGGGGRKMYINKRNGD